MKRRLSACALLAVSLTAFAAPIPFKPDTGVSVTGSALGVLGVSVLAIVAVLVLRRRLRLDAPKAGGKLLRVLESQRLGPRALLTVVEFDGTRYLVAQGEQGISCLATAPARTPA